MAENFEIFPGSKEHFENGESLFVAVQVQLPVRCCSPLRKINDGKSWSPRNFALAPSLWDPLAFWRHCKQLANHLTCIVMPQTSKTEGDETWHQEGQSNESNVLIMTAHVWSRLKMQLPL
jgi:hypothetical protein